MNRCCPSRWVLMLLGAFAVCWTAAVQAQVKPIFESQLITTKTPGHAVEVDVDLTGAKKLYLVVTDGGNGFACDWADWAEPRLIGPDGEQKLTELKWKAASAEWGRARIDKNADGGPLRINGKPVDYGIGTHANSIIEYDLPEGITRFKARAGLDNGGTDQQNGQATSVRFLVFTEKPPITVAQAQSAAPNADAGNRTPDLALEGLEVAEGLEATLFASEPMMLNPTNIDIDHLGRVWVCEVVNYRHRNGSRPEGDRILILEDTNGDGQADKKTVFYQGRDIDSALGICVLGNKVIVSCAPNVFVFTDENGDGKADKKELLFTKVGVPQHDHSTHAFVFGPDGKLYWNVGNTGQAVHDKEGNPIVDLAGNTVNDSGNPYRQGLVFRCNLDGTDFEVLGHNFRNNYEVAVDSFGTLWQSDNDDDGHRGVRINFVMEFGNYGYTDELTGAGWRTPRTGMHDDVPHQHWHQNDPGVVPNLLHTGAGSPTGICVYEGDLLPEIFQNQMIHCDAGPNIVRAYPVEKSGAGYTADIVNVLEGVHDKWFRPADVCVAPDGSLIVADWYDPGVGGHRMGDIERGRLFRVAPPQAPYEIPKFDFSTAEGAIEALKNPNLSARYLAWTALHEMGAQAEPALLKVWNDSENPRFRARALWLLGKQEGRGATYIEQALGDADPDLRITGLRLARQLNVDLVPYLKQLVEDSAPEVRRECAIAIRHLDAPEAAELWATLAWQHDGEDRWYLEALGIGADGRWDEFFSAWLSRVGDDWNTPAGRDIVWRSRSEAALPLLSRIISDSKTEGAARLRYFRAFDFHRPTSQEGRSAKQTALISLLAGSHPEQAEIRSLALKHLGTVDINSSAELKAAVDQTLEDSRGTSDFLALVMQFRLSDRYPEVLALAQQHPDEQIGVEAMQALLGQNQGELIQQALRDENPEVAGNTARALGNTADGRALGLLMPLVHDEKQPVDLRRQSARAVARSRNGALELVKLTREKKLDESLHSAVAAALHAAQWDDVKQHAQDLFPLPPSKNNEPLPPIAELAQRRGDADRGKLVFNTEGTCAKCHVVNGVGKDVGPNLSEIGDKLSRHAFFESILYPSAGISHNYETYVLVLEDGNTVSGLLTSETPDSVSIKSADAIVRTFKKSEIEEMLKQDVSLMPADLQKVMTVEELVDVVEYMTTLKKEK